MPATFDQKTALIVVDVQNDFAHPDGSLYVRDAEEIFPALEDLVARAQKAGSIIVYTKDWHPPETPHFKAQGGIWPAHCVAGTWGAALHERVPRASPAVFIHKGQGPEDGYSAFTVIDPRTGERSQTGLAALLRRLDVTRVVIAGLATDYCVNHTVMDALDLGFLAEVVEAAVRAVDLQPGDGARALGEMAARGAVVVREHSDERAGAAAPSP